MLWSLIKIVGFVCVVAAVAFGAVQLMGLSGGVRIAMGGMEYNLTPLMAVGALLMLIVLVWLGLKLLKLLLATWRFLNGDETAISRYFERGREEKGFKALSEGMVALAAGEGRTAIEKAERADRYLQKPELTNLLTAQAAEMAGDTKKAEAAYRKLLESDKTRFVAVRGIMKQKLAEGDTDKAMKLAEKAFLLKPSHEEVQNTLLTLQSQNGDWSGARKTLDAKLKHGSIPRDVHRRRNAVLALSEAKDVLSDATDIEARESAIEANRLSPDLVPAAVMAADSYAVEGQQKYATRVLKKAWDAHPHPDLAAAYARIDPDETPAQRIKRFNQLVKSQKSHPESRMTMAELQIAAEDFPAARAALGDLVETQPEARVLTIMAAIERGEGADESVIKGWLAKALSAPRGPRWVCDKCQHVHAVWEPICDNCESLDTLTWTTPPEANAEISSGTAMLPLIVGALEDKSNADEAQDLSDAEVIEDTPKPPEK